MATFQIDPAHTLAEFEAKHMMFTTVKGRFTRTAGEVVFDEADPTRSSVVATAETASVTTGDPNRDGHVRSPDFFDVERFPILTFRSRRIEPGRSDGHYQIVGDLTIRDVTREVVFDAVHLGEGITPQGKVAVGFSATTTVNRKDFDLRWNVPLEKGGFLVGDNVKINLEVQAIKTAE